MSSSDLKYAWIYFWSAAGLLFERFWHSFWPALSVLAVFIACACLNILTYFGPQAHLALLFVFTAAFSIACTRFGAAFRFPAGREIRRVIEVESEMRHRPLEAMLDKPVDGTDEHAQKLWSSYQERLARLRDGAKAYRPKPDAGRRDPYSFRIAAAVLLALGLLTAQHDAIYRVRQALWVDLAKLVHVKPVAIDVWITPPAYTGQNPVFLATTQLGATAIQGGVSVPENSILKVRLSGYDEPPHVTYGDAETPAFTEPAPHNFTMEMPLDKDGELRIKKGWFRMLGDWRVSVIPDKPPEITYIGTEKSEHATLKIKYKVSDDYGIKKVYGVIAPTPALQKIAEGRTIDFDIPVPEDMHKDEQVYVADLASHPWAGAEVMLTLNAVDAADHSSATPEQKILLPERDFQNPTAKRIIAARKKLIWYDNLLTQRNVSQELADIASIPQNYKFDLIVFLGLDMATKRLMYDGGPAAVESDIALLWDLAIRVEDGGLSLAKRELSDALQRLSEGLKDKSLSKDDLQKLMDDVQQKMREYVKTLSQEMAQRMQEGKQQPQLSQDLADKLMKKIDMGKLMQQLKDLSSGTEREQMEKMAQFMKGRIDNFDPAKMDKMQQAQRKAMEALNQLQKLIERQQSLLDHTNKMQPKNGQQQQQQEQQQQDQSGNQGQDQQEQSGNSGQQQDQQQQSGNGGQQDQQQQSGSGGQQDQQQQAGGNQPGQQQQAGGNQPGQQQQAGGNQPGQQQEAGGNQPGQQQQAGGNQPGQQQQAGGNQPGQQQQAGGNQPGQQQQAGGNQPGQQQQAGGNQPGQQQQAGGNQPGQQQQAGGNQPGQQQQAGGNQPGQQQQAGGNQPGQQQQTGGNQPGQQQQAGGNQPGQQEQAGGNQPGQQQTGGNQPGQQQANGAGGQENGQSSFNPSPDALKGQQQAGQGGKEKYPDVKTPQQGAAEQGNIRGKLGDILRDLGSGMQSLPEQFSKADQSMKAAQNALKGGDAQGSAPAQRQALENLQKAEDDALEQMAKGLQMMLSMGFNPGNGSSEGGYGDGFDPLGREDENGKAMGVIKLPDEKERRRVQQIIEELRSRSNEYDRPKIERDYIDRLLEQFD